MGIIPIKGFIFNLSVGRKRRSKYLSEFQISLKSSPYIHIAVYKIEISVPMITGIFDHMPIRPGVFRPQYFKMTIKLVFGGLHLQLFKHTQYFKIFFFKVNWKQDVFCFVNLLLLMTKKNIHFFSYFFSDLRWQLNWNSRLRYILINSTQIYINNSLFKTLAVRINGII